MNKTAGFDLVSVLAHRPRPRVGARRRRSGPMRLASCLVGGCCAAVCLGAEPGSLLGKPRNILVNGGFEEGFRGWRPDPAHKIVSDPKQAHSGHACLFGEVTRPGRFLRLIQRAPVRAGNMYEFEVWARATNRTKLVLWAIRPGDKTRRMIAAWRNLPRRWRRFRIPITISRSGTLELQLIAPSAVAAPVGKLWLDDAALYETPMPPAFLLAENGFNDEPAVASLGGGAFAVAWISFRDGRDTLQAARIELDAGGNFHKTAAWQVEGGPSTYILGVRLVPAGDTAWLLYAAEVGRDDWDIVARPITKNGPGRRIRVAPAPGIDVNPAGAWDGRSLHVVWESNRTGARTIWYTRIDAAGRGSRTRQVSAKGFSNYDPSVAVTPGGDAAVAWTSFRESNYDVYFRRWRGGRWGAERRLTHAPTIDRHPMLAVSGDDLWVVYENAQSKRYHVTATVLRRLIAARITPEGLQAPVALHESAPFRRGEGACPVFDRQGRLWISFLRPRGRAGWDAFLIGFTGRTWTPLQRWVAGKGMDRVPWMCLAGSRAVAVIQNDDIPPRWPNEKASTKSHSKIMLAQIDLAHAPPAEPAKLAPLKEPEAPYVPGQLRNELGEDAPPASITYRGRKLFLYYGDLHEHTDVSPCNRSGDQSIEESYQHMRDINHLDFAAITDHGYDINPYLWNYTAKMARVNYDPGRFLTFLGEEWTSSFEKYDAKHPYGYYGHRNLILENVYFPRWWNAWNGQTPADVWKDLRAMKANFVHIPHQLADTGNVPTDWSYTDETAQPVAEIFQTRGSYEYKGAPRQAGRSTPAGWFIQDAWAKGIVIGVIASPDHGGGYGKACVFAPELSRPAILDALRARHCFGTTGAKIFLDVRVNGRLMGEKIPLPHGPVDVRVNTRCPQPIDRIEVCRNNRFIYSRRGQGRTAEFVFRDQHPILNAWSYYYVRVIQTDGEIAWSSPVWLGMQQR